MSSNPCRLPGMGQRKLLLMLVSILAIAIPSLALAQAETGTITGFVSNQGTRQLLNQAEVRIEGTDRVVLTDPEGSYTFRNVTPGEHTLVASYTGLDALKQTVTVGAGQTVRNDFELTAEIYRMAKFVVAGEVEGQAYAINRRQNSEHMMEAISSDVFGSVTEGNLGEFLKNLAGIQIEYNAADARTIRVRGQEDFLTNVMVDGVQYASASSSNTTRAFEVDQLNVNNIETIEVFKAPPPSQSPSIGGTVNLVTKNAFQQKGRRVVGTFNLNANSEDLDIGRTPGPGNRETHKISLGGSFNYSEAFLDNTFGVSLSLAESNQHNEQHSVTKSYTFPGATGRITRETPGYLSQYQILDGPKFANRRNFGLNFDYKLSNNTTLAWKNTFNRYRAQIRDRTFRLRGNTTPVGGATVATIEDATFPQNTNVRADSGEAYFNKFSQDWSSRFAVRHKLNDYTINYDAGFSKSTNHYKSLPHTFRGISAEVRNIGFRIVMPENEPAPTLIQQTAGPDLYNLANYTVTGTGSNTDRNSADFILSGKVDARRDFNALKIPFYLQTGYAFKQQERTILRPDPNYVHVGPDGVVGGTDDTITTSMFPERVYTVSPGFGLRAFPWADPIALASYFKDHPNAFIEGNQADANYIRKLTSDRFIRERIQAVYIMGNFRFTKRLSVLAGGRKEFTDFMAKDYQRDESKPVLREQFSRRTTKIDTRSPFFRNLQGKFNFTPSLQARASFTDGQGRQNFSDLIPSTNFDDEGQIIRQNNSGLKPRESKNYDVSLEYYFKPAGTVSVGWFKKDIRNYVVSEEIDLGENNPFGPEYNGWTLITSRNAGWATYSGVEADYRHQLRFLPGWFKGLTVFANYTNIYETEGDFGGSTIVTELPGLITESYNAGVRFDSPRRRFFLQAKQNYRGEHLRSSGTNPTYNVTDKTWDFSLGGQLGKRVDVELVVRNAFVGPRRISQYTGSRYIQWHEYGAQYSLIFRWRL